MSEKLKVPDEWCCVNHIDIAEINPKFDINQFKEDVEVSFLPMASVKEISGNYDLSQSRKLSAVKKGYTNFKNGDIIFAKITPCMENGKIAVLDNLLNGMGFGSTEFHVSRPYHDINAQFLFYYFVQSAFRKKAQRIMTGSAGQLRVSTEYFKKVNIPIPPLPEQRAIVSKVEQLFSDLDNGIDNFKKAQEQLKRYRQSVLKAACEGRLVPTEAELACAEGRDYEPADVLLTRILKERREKWNGKGKYKEPAAPDTSGLPELPEGWCSANVGQMTDSMKNGIYKPKEFYAEGGFACLRMYNIDQGKIVWNDIKRMNLTKEEIDKYLLVSGDLLVNRVNSRELVGKAAVISSGIEKCVFESKNIRVRVLNKVVNPYYLCYHFTLAGTEYFNRNAQQVVGMASISQPQIARFPVLLPPLAEQHRIVTEVEHRISHCDKMEETIAESLQKAESLRQSILKKAFEGKLLNAKELEEARNAPDWEPAEKLLERIRQEKQIKENNNKPTRRKTHG